MENAPDTWKQFQNFVTDIIVMCERDSKWDREMEERGRKWERDREGESEKEIEIERQSEKREEREEEREGELISFSFLYKIGYFHFLLQANMFIKDLITFVENSYVFYWPVSAAECWVLKGSYRFPNRRVQGLVAPSFLRII